MKSLLRTIYTALLVMNPLNTAYAQLPTISYDAAQDRVTILANDTTLTELATGLSETVAVETQVDPAISDERLSIRISASPLDHALLQMFRHYSHVIQYHHQGGQMRILSIALLPRGDVSNITSTPVVPYAVPARQPVINSSDYLPPDQVADNAPSGAPLPRRSARYLDDLTPSDQAVLSEDERLALPVRPAEQEDVE